MTYPVTFEADYVERRSRLTTFFRLILVIPLVIVASVYGLLAVIAIIFAWFAIVITGDYPRGLFDFVAGFTRFVTRVTAYAVLLCDAYPPFWGHEDPAYPVRMHFAPLERYSRLKTLFRIILAIPIVILRYVMQLLLEVSAIFAWFIILVLGKLPRGLHDIMVLANSYIARSDAYLYLLSETYPPFQDEQTRAAGGPPQPVAPPSEGPIPPPSGGATPSSSEEPLPG
jgi:hypothetical protein